MLACRVKFYLIVGVGRSSVTVGTQQGLES